MVHCTGPEFNAELCQSEVILHSSEIDCTGALREVRTSSPLVDWFSAVFLVEEQGCSWYGVATFTRCFGLVLTSCPWVR